MKQKLLILVLSVTLFSLRFGAAQNISGVKWTVKNPFEQKAFIENKGQYDVPGEAVAKDILFYARQGGLQYYFTPTGILISRIVSVKRSEKEIEQLKLKEEGNKTEEDNDDDLEFKRIEQFHEMKFDGANSQDTITGANEVSWCYSYTLKGDSDVKAHAWKKLTYHNLYPGIDMEFYFPEDKQGFEYSFIVHPGADVSQIKILYNGAITFNSDGKITIASPYGNFTGYAPVAKLLSSNKEIKCDFSLSNGGVKFTADNYDKSETLLIDPLIITPTFNRTNDAYDLDWDDAGNIYVYGGSYPWQILKYNSAGTFLWSYTTIFDGNNQYIGDFAVDRHSQSVYVTEGRNDQNNTGAIVIKLNSAGGFITQYNGNMDFNEMWKIAFSSCTDQAVIAGGGSTDPSYTASYLDTNLTNLSLVNALNADIGYHDMWGLALDNFGNSYMVTAQSLFGPVSQTDSFDNVILKLPLPALVPTTWKVPSNYDVLEHSSLTYGLNGAFQPGNGYNGMTVSDTTLYTYDSYVLKQWGTKNGNILDSVFVNGPSEDNQINWGGLTSDDCGNIFLGSINTVEQYNSDLNLVQTFAEPDTVYDVRLSNTDMLYACGINFISAAQVSLPSCHIIKVTNTIKNVDCDTLGSAIITPTGGTPPYTITWNTVPVQVGNTVTGLYAGTYIATIVDSSCIIQTYLDTINVLTNAIQLTPNNATICEGNSATLSASGAVSTYSWSPSTELSSTSGSSVVASPTITTTYTVIGTSTAGCTDTIQSIVTVNPAPVIVVTNPSPICIGISTTLTASGATTYSWSPSTGLSDSTGSSVTANHITTKTYTITGTDSIGCSGTTTVTVTVNPNPTITVSTPSPICNGTSTTLIANGAATYLWTPSTGLSSTTGSSITANPTITTTYTITGTDSNGCTGTTTVLVTVNPNPTITVVTPTPMCTGSSTTLIVNGGVTYLWTPSTGLSATTDSSVTANPTTTTTYTVTGTDVNGCTGTTTVTVTVNPNPMITVATPAPICSGSNTTLTANGAESYSWTPSIGLNATAGSSIIANPATTTTYTISGTDTNGCTNTTAVTVTINPNLIVTVVTPAPICIGSSATLTANGAATYTWSPSLGLSNTTGSLVIATPIVTLTYTITGTSGVGCSSATTVIVTVNPNPTITVATPAPICNGTSTTLTANGAVSYSWTPSTGLSATSGSLVTASPTTTTTYTVTGTDVNGCTATTTVIVTINPNPAITVETPAPICNGTSTTLIANGAATYSWTPVTGLSATTGLSVTANPTITTTYSVTGTDVNGCIGTTTVIVTVNPNPTITVSTPAPICSGGSTTLTANGAIIYNWTPAIGLAATTGLSVTANPATTTTYTVSGTDTNGCTNTTTVVVTVNPNLIVTGTTPAPICVGSSATLTANGAGIYTWSPSTGLSNTTGSSVTATPAVTSTYTITGTSGVGCSSTTTVTVTVNPNPIITVATPAPICNGTNTTLIANGAATYIWTPVTGLSATTGSSVTTNPTITTTYIITGTDGNGCIGTITVPVTVNLNPTITVATPAPICNGASTILTANGATTYTWTPATGLSATTSSSVTANPTTTTTYNVIGMDGNGCIGTTAVIVTVNLNPTITVATPAPICNGRSAPLTANGATTYIWTPVTGLSATTGSLVIADPIITTTYNVVGTDGNGCTTTTAVIVTVNPNPAITVTTPRSICSGNSATMTVTGATTYTWSPSLGLNDTTGSSVIVTPTITSTYIITGTTAGGCTGTTTVMITVNPNPTIIVSTPSPICVGSNTTLIANGATTYSWLPSIGLSATSGSSVTANPTTTLTYTVTGVDVNGCMAAAIVPVTVNPNPIIGVTTPPPMCNGSSTALTASGASTYAWTPSIGLNNSTGSSVTAYSTITTTYNVTGTDSNTCTTTTKVVVMVNPNPTITAISPPPMCSGNSTTLTAKGAITYLWTPSTGLSNSTGSSVSANPAITITYTIMGIDGNGCSSTTEINVNIYPLPQITVNFPPAFCKGDSATLVARGAISYSWSPSTGLSATSGSSVLSKPGNSVTYTVTGISSSGCSGTSEVSVLVNPNPTVSAPPPPGICKGNSQALRASGADNYSWSPSEGLNMTSGSSVIANPTTSTTYTVIGTNEAGCSGEAQVQLLVMPLPSVSVFGLSPSYCTNSSPVTLIGNPKGGTFSGNGVDSNQFNPVLTGEGTYLIKYVYTDSNGCEDSSISLITVNPLPKVIVNPNNPTVCSGIPVTLNAMGADNYIWRPGTGLSDSTASNVTADPTVTTTYVVTGINSDSCFDTAMVTVYVDSTPTASFNAQTSNYCEPLTMQFNNASNDGVSYNWDFGDGTTSNESNPQHTYKQGGTYQVILTVTSQYGCVNDTIKEVIIKQSFDDLVQIGNAFTPDDDGINSIITPHVLCTDLSGYVFRVYNRWGQLLFQTYDPNIGWDGKFNGQMQLVGVYDYYIEFNCGDCKIFKKGNITLLK